MFGEYSRLREVQLLGLGEQVVDGVRSSLELKQDRVEKENDNNNDKYNRREVREIYNLKHIINTSLVIFTIIRRNYRVSNVKSTCVGKPKKYVEQILEDVLNGIMSKVECKIVSKINHVECKLYIRVEKMSKVVWKLYKRV